MSVDSPPPLQNVLGQLRAEHAEIKALFALHAEEPSPLVRTHLVSRLCRMLRLHFAVESGVFVPAVAAVCENYHLLEQTGAEYASLTAMINELASSAHSSERLPALVDELHRSVDQHIATAEAQDGALTQAPGLAIDWAALETAIALRRAELSPLR